MKGADLQSAYCRITAWGGEGGSASGLEWRIYFILTATVIRPTSASRRPGAPWAEPPPCLVLTRTSSCGFAFFIFFLPLGGNPLSLSVKPAAADPRRPTDRVGHVDVNVTAAYSGRRSIQRRIPACLSDALKALPFLFPFFLSLLETELASALSRSSPISPKLSAATFPRKS